MISGRCSRYTYPDIDIANCNRHLSTGDVRIPADCNSALSTQDELRAMSLEFKTDSTQAFTLLYHAFIQQLRLMASSSSNGLGIGHLALQI